MRAPCYQCLHRSTSPNCHMSCELYRLYVEERERIRRKKELMRQGRDAQIRAVEKKWMDKLRRNSKH